MNPHTDEDMIYESELKPGPGLQIRNGSKFQSYLSNLIYAPPKNFIKEDKATTKEVNSGYMKNMKSVNNKDASP